MPTTTPESPSRIGWSAPKLRWPALSALALIGAAVVFACFCASNVQQIAIALGSVVLIAKVAMIARAFATKTIPATSEAEEQALSL